MKSTFKDRMEDLELELVDEPKSNSSDAFHANVVAKRGDAWCVLHGHPKREGSKTDEPEGSVIKCFSIGEFGEAGARKRAEAMHAAIVISQSKRNEEGRTFRSLGGPGSGNFGHAGRPGEVGGSAPGGAEGGSSSKSVEGYHIREKFLAEEEAMRATFAKDIALVKAYEEKLDAAVEAERKAFGEDHVFNYEKIDATGVQEASERIRKAEDEVNERFRQALTLPREEQVTLGVYPVNDSATPEADKLQRWADRVQNMVEKDAFLAPGESEETTAFVRVEKGVRSTYDIAKNEITLGHVARDHFYHELGHQLERGAGNQAACRRFLENRARGKEIKPLSTITGNKAYESDEVARSGKFVDAYVGKVYRSGQTEVLSVGLEKLMTAPIGFARKDPEHFDLVVDCMRGRFRKGQPTEQRIYTKKQKVRS